MSLGLLNHCSGSDAGVISSTNSLLCFWVILYFSVSLRSSHGSHFDVHYLCSETVAQERVIQPHTEMRHNHLKWFMKSYTFSKLCHGLKHMFPMQKRDSGVAYRGKNHEQSLISFQLLIAVASRLQHGSHLEWGSSSDVTRGLRAD